MKKQLLFASAILITGIVSAQVSKKANRIPANIANKAVKVEEVYGNESSIQSANSSSPVKPNSALINNAKIASITSTIVGTTYYDLQSNASVGDRIIVNADGTISTCWTFSSDVAKTFADRGTGYNYFNGTTWNPAPTLRIENAKVGWGNIVNTRSGAELVLSHNGGVSALNVASRTTKGTGTWANTTTAIPSANAGGNYWPRMVNKGDTVYAIAITYPPSSGGTAYMGLKGAVVFSRSKDAGATWDIINAIPNGLDNTKFSGFKGDDYAIAANGNTVAIAVGGLGRDVALVKSTDAGTTWTYSLVRKFAIPHYDEALATTDANGDAIPDTLSSNDGSLAIGLDNNGKAYVFYGLTKVLVTTPSATGLSYFPGVDGLMMWNESFPVGSDTGGVMVAAIEDLYQQGKIFFPTPPSGESSFGSVKTGLTSMPSVAFDASNTMYLSYSSAVDSLMAITPNSTTKLVRHVYVIKSTNGGTTWTSPCDLVGLPNGIPYEGVYASMAKRVNGFVHIIYQRDLAPGNGIPAASGATANPDAADNTDANDIIYLKIPVGDIGTCQKYLQGINELASSVSNLNFYPNPASSNGTIEVSLVENAKMDIVVMNSVGQTVYTTSFEGTSGNNKVDINLSNLSTGLYFYQVKIANSKSVTKKFVVQK